MQTEEKNPADKIVGSSDGLGGSLFSEPPREVWIVSTPTGPDHVAITRECAMEYAAIMAGDFPELGPWRVCKYVAEPFQAKQPPPNEKWCVGCTPEDCSCCGT